MIYKNGERKRDFLGLFISIVVLVFYILGGVFNKTFIPLALFGYEMISYPTRAHGKKLNKQNVSEIDLFKN